MGKFLANHTGKKLLPRKILMNKCIVIWNINDDNFGELFMINQIFPYQNYPYTVFVVCLIM